MKGHCSLLLRTLLGASGVHPLLGGVNPSYSRRLRQEDPKSEARLGNMARFRLKNKRGRGRTIRSFAKATTMFSS